jgi:TolB protein
MSMKDFTLTGFLRAERYTLVGLGCAVILLACLVLAFFTIWRRFPSGSAPAPAGQTTSLPGLPASTPVDPPLSPAISTDLPATLVAVTPTSMPSLAGMIVYVCFLDGFDEICMMDPDGGGQTRLTSSPATDFYPSLSPDGTEIVLASRRDGQFEIYAIDLNTGSQRRLTDQIGSAFAPEISPDGRLIAFTNARGGNQSIWIMNRDGTDPKPLTDESAEDIDPTWSPDGQLLAFASTRSGEGTQIHILDLVTREIRAVTKGLPEIGGRVDWSPDGTTLAFYAGPQNGREIFFVNIDGSNLRQMTSGGDNLAPAFSPDGTWFAYTSYRTGNNEIYRMQIDGQEIVQLTDNDHADWQPRWGP